MPRQARIDYPGALNHVIGRGIERRNIFLEEKDKEEFVRRIKLSLSKSSMQCYAWCIMDNHFHLLLISGKTKLSSFMSSLLTGYAVYYNRAHKRAGHLFQNRYKSIVCDREEYLLTLIRYIHLNPIRAEKTSHDVKDLGRYRWSSHNEIIGRIEEGIVEREEMLSYFGDRENKAYKAYMKYLQEGVGLKEDYTGGGLIRSVRGIHNLLSNKPDERQMYDERILGNGGFVEGVLKQIEKEEDNKAKIKDMEMLLKKVSNYYGVEIEEILGSRRKEVRESRSVVVYLGNRYLGKSITCLGRMLGIRQPAASIAVKRGKEICERKGFIENLI